MSAANELTAVPHPYRTLANTIINLVYRNGPVEDMHAGQGYTFSLDHRRFTDRKVRSIIRHTAESLNPFVTDFPLWDNRLIRLPPWPESVAGLLLAEHGIVVDFMGDWDDLAAYRFITEELLDEEMDDIRIEGMFTHFEATTPEYDVQMWVNIFVTDLFWQDRKDFVAGLDKQPLYNNQGDPISLAEFAQKLELVGARLPAETRAFMEPINTQVTDDEGRVTAVITWQLNNEPKQVESFFRLQPSPYFGWDVVQTSLLDDLLAIVR